MFKSSSRDNVNQLALSKRAKELATKYEKMLSVRISLQKVIDEVNILPSSSSSLTTLTNNANNNNYNKNEQQKALECEENIELVLNKMVDIYHQQSKLTNYHDDVSVLDEKINNMMSSMTDKWSPIINKLHSKMNFGNEKMQGNMKVFNQT